jgi:hypothetical protein
MNRYASLMVALLLGTLNWSELSAQNQDETNALPRFDVVSVKRDTSGEGPANDWQRSPGRIDYQNTQLIQLIRVAWGSISLRVEGGPDWIRTDRFDVDVRFPVDTPGPTTVLMLRQLLNQRFKLSARIRASPLAAAGSRSASRRQHGSRRRLQDRSDFLSSTSPAFRECPDADWLRWTFDSHSASRAARVEARKCTRCSASSRHRPCRAADGELSGSDDVVRRPFRFCFAADATYSLHGGWRKRSRGFEQESLIIERHCRGFDSTPMW